MVCIDKNTYYGLELGSCQLVKISADKGIIRRLEEVKVIPRRYQVLKRFNKDLLIIKEQLFRLKLIVLERKECGHIEFRRIASIFGNRVNLSDFEPFGDSKLAALYSDGLLMIVSVRRSQNRRVSKRITSKIKLSKMVNHAKNQENLTAFKVVSVPGGSDMLVVMIKNTKGLKKMILLKYEENAKVEQRLEIAYEKVLNSNQELLRCKGFLDKAGRSYVVLHLKTQATVTSGQMLGLKTPDEGSTGEVLRVFNATESDLFEVKHLSRELGEVSLSDFFVTKAGIMGITNTGKLFKLGFGGQDLLDFY